jgi:hypothetical protein
VAEFVVTDTPHHLGNGLEVVLHQDMSEPMAAATIICLVRSARQAADNIGFADLIPPDSHETRVM